ncbi:unnamed protein product [Soboliphyme baturini]|uniref:Alpha-type protein kinase domain-containing protein n=1 Tax=Soboliphyme baturini TaxID=241478 RepID=A0A183IF90_9BILA|nr:unnamed protein product [Soboliphyme baturini]
MVLPGSSNSTSPKSKPNSENVFDLEALILRWARQIFDITKTKEQARIPKDFLEFTINWKQAKFHYGSPTYSGIPSFKKRHDPRCQVQPQLLFRTYFVNKTNQEQEYSFKAERVTRSACTVIIEQGLTRGAEFGLKLATPCEVLEANAGFKREITLANIDEDTVEEEMTWGVDSALRVPPMTETTAELIMTEAHCSSNFTMETRMHGRVIVSVTNLRDNNSLVTVIEGNLADIMQKEICSGLRGFRIDKNVVIAEYKGQCYFRFGLEQRINITSKPLQPS